jgi:hypothetical protein
VEAEGCSVSATLHCGNVQSGSSAAHCRQGSALSHQDFCELVPAVPSLPPSQLHRDNRPRSHPPHFASTASVPTPPPPQSIKMRRFAPTSPLGVLAASFLSLGRSHAEQTRVRVPDLSRRSCCLYVLSRGQLF